MKKNNIILGLLFIGVLMGALDISIVGPAIPSIHQSLGLDEQQVSWIFSIYILFSLMGISLFARLSDRFGRRPFYILAVSIFGIGSLLVAMAHNIELLLIGRAIQGFGASGIFPVASATVGDIFPREKRGRALGLIGMVFGLAFLTGPVLAGLMLKFFTWNSLFLINIPIVIIVIIGSIKLLPANKNSDSKIIDWPGIISLGLFLSGFTIALNNLKTAGFWETILSLSFYPFIVVGLIAFVAFILIERRSPHPIVDTRLFHLKQVRIVGFLAFGTGLYQAAFVFVPGMTVLLFGVEPSTASFMLLPVVLAMAISSPISGRMIDKYGSRIIINIALVLMGIGLTLLFAVPLTRPVYYFAGVMLGIGLSVLAGSSLRYIMLNEVSASERASAQGVLTIMISFGQIIASALIGAFTAGYRDSIKGYQLVFAILTFITIILGISSLRLKSKIQEKEMYTGQ